MTVYTRIVLGLALFLVAAGSVYGLTSHELVGTPLLLISAGCSAYIGLFVRREVRAAAAAETHGDAHRGDEAEPHVGPTIWPFVFALAAVGLALGAIFNHWLLAAGGALFAAAAVGWSIDVGRQWRHDR